MKFFHLSVRLTNEKPDAFVCPFDKPMKSLYFRSFVVSVLFARFHFKVIRKSLYFFCIFQASEGSRETSVGGHGAQVTRDGRKIDLALPRLKKGGK